MNALAMDELGERGSVRDIPDPAPGEGQVEIRVGAAGVNPFDSAAVRGQLKDMMEHRFPFVPGTDASGTVEAVGEGVTTWSVGDDVFGSVGKPYLGEGTLAERATMSAGSVARKPISIDHATAAAVPVAGVAARALLDALDVADGRVVVAIGATGGVGSFLLQLAVREGARVAAVCSAENADYARALGAADVLDYAAGDVVEMVRSHFPDGIDAIADLHGTRTSSAGSPSRFARGGVSHPPSAPWMRKHLPGEGSRART